MNQYFDNRPIQFDDVPGITNFASTADVVTTNLQLQLDAGDASSYSGSGQNFLDLTANNYDFYLGTGSGSDAADPTFNSGSPDYFSGDGGDWFSQQAAYSGSIMMIAGRNNVDFTVETWVYFAGTTEKGVWGTTNGGVSNTNGIAMRWSRTSQRVSLLVGPLNSHTGANSTNITTGAWHQIAVTGKCDGSTITYYVDGAADGTTSANNSGWTSGDAANNMTFFAEAASSPLQSGSRMAIIRMYDAILTSGDILQNYNANKARFGLS